MPADPQAILAKLLIDPADLAALRDAGTSPEISTLLQRVAGLLADVQARLDAGNSILVDAEEAGRLLGCSAKTLVNHCVPAVFIGSRRLYRRATLEQWAAEHEGAGDAAGVSR